MPENIYEGYRSYKGLQEWQTSDFLNHKNDYDLKVVQVKLLEVGE